MDYSEKAEELINLAEKAKQGDKTAFDRIYTILFQKIFQFIFFRVNHKEIAEDLTEEVFIKAFNKLELLSNTRTFTGWLFQIARNSVIDYYRAKKLTVNLADVENTLEYETNVVDILHLNYQQAILLKLLKQLNSTEQAVIKMKFLEDLNTEEIAVILNETTGNIRVIQHRALNKLIDLRKQSENEEDE
jgi:RNA polymerase sigma-70 factor (ECF subfamily)